MACHAIAKATCHIAGCSHLVNSLSWFQSHMTHCRVLPPSEFNDMSSQSHVSLCRVGLLPLGEFTVLIPEPHATLQGVKIPSTILKIVFRHILFFFLMHFWLWRSAAFVSSPIHLSILFWMAAFIAVGQYCVSQIHRLLSVYFVFCQPFSDVLDVLHEPVQIITKEQLSYTCDIMRMCSNAIPIAIV